MKLVALTYPDFQVFMAEIKEVPRSIFYWKADSPNATYVGGAVIVWYTSAFYARFEPGDVPVESVLLTTFASDFPLAVETGLPINSGA